MEISLFFILKFISLIENVYYIYLSIYLSFNLSNLPLYPFLCIITEFRNSECLCSLQMQMYNVHFTIHCTLYTVNCTLYIVQSTLFASHCTLYIKFSLYNVNCKYYTVRSTHKTTLYTVQ